MLSNMCGAGGRARTFVGGACHRLAAMLSVRTYIWVLSGRMQTRWSAVQSCRTSHSRRVFRLSIKSRRVDFADTRRVVHPFGSGSRKFSKTLEERPQKVHPTYLAEGKHIRVNMFLMKYSRVSRW